MSIFCPQGSGNSRRYVHPSIEDWPFPGCGEDRLGKLPFLNWKAGTPQEVYKQFEEELEKFEKHLNSHRGKLSGSLKFWVKTRAAITGAFNGQWRIDHHSQHWSWQAAGKKLGGKHKSSTDEFDILIMAIGFGSDSRKGTNGYWEDDSHHWSQIQKLKPSEKVAIFGRGDGAIIEAVCAALIEKTAAPEPEKLHATLVSKLVSWRSLSNLSHESEQKKMQLLKALRQMEDDVKKRKIDAAELFRAYSSLQSEYGDELKKLDKELGLLQKSAPYSSRPSLRQVCLISPGVWPYEPKSFAINRFLLWRLIQNERIHYSSGKVPADWPPPTDDKLEREKAKTNKPNAGKKRQQLIIPVNRRGTNGIGKKEDSIHAHSVICRLGTQKALPSQYPELAAICQRHLHPKNELDQTRINAWPENFFGTVAARAPENSYDSIQASAPDSPAPTVDYKITVAKTCLKIAKFDVIHMIDTFNPYRGENGSIKILKNSWVEGTSSICFHGATIPKGFIMEHRATPCEPFRLQVTALSEKLQIKRLLGNPSWAVAYQSGEEITNENLKVSLLGAPCSALHFADSTGFPVFGDMEVKKLVCEIRFKGIIPVIPEKTPSSFRWLAGAVASYQEPIRRLGYEDGEIELLNQQNMLHGFSADAIRQVQDDGHSTFKITMTWESEDGGCLPPGFFYGLQWDHLRLAAPML